MDQLSVKVGILLAYDYELSYTSLPLVYKDANKIVLSLDKNRKTYKGNYFSIPSTFFKWLEKMDIDKKICIYEDDFAPTGLTPMQCEVRQRQMTAEKMGKGGWHIQLDVDEYFVNFKLFVEQLRRFEKKLKSDEHVTVFANWITLFKKLETGFLYTKYHTGYELCHIATNFPDYDYGRASKDQKILLSDNFIIHDSWARNEEQLVLKLGNWSHSNDFDSDKFLKLWYSINEMNFNQFRNFHPINPHLWSSLGFFNGRSIEEILWDANTKLESKIKPWKTKLRNRKGGGKILSLFNYLK